MLKLQNSSLVLILTVVVLTAGCVSIYTLGYTPGTAWHKAEDVQSGTFGSNVGNGNYNFPGNVGIKKTNPSSQLDVTGDIYATGQVIVGTRFKVGSSELSSSQLKVNGSSLVVTSTGEVGIGTTSPQVKLEVSGNIIAARPTTADQVATKGYVDELIAVVNGLLPLVNGVHTQQDCINAGGEVVNSDLVYKQCRFNASACPSGWTQYKNWSTTINPSSCGGCYCQGGGCCIEGTYWANYLISGNCGRHTWSNTAQETTVYGTNGVPVGWTQCLGMDCCRCTIESPITQVGCY